MKKERLREKGFGLLELLFVIAFIGFLALIVLSASYIARQKAEDNRVRNAVRQMRWLAEEVYDTQGGSYEDWAQNPNITERLAVLEAEIDDVHNATGITIIRESQRSDYCISAPLKSISSHYCVDASGAFVTTTGTCPPEEIDEEPLACPSSS